MRTLFLLCAALFSAAAAAETSAQINLQINPSTDYYYGGYDNYPGYYPSRSYYFYNGSNQYGGGEIQTTEQYSRGGIGYTEHRNCHTSAGSTICTGNWRPGITRARQYPNQLPALGAYSKSRGALSFRLPGAICLPADPAPSACAIFPLFSCPV